jgi:hypothetical protein
MFGEASALPRARFRRQTPGLASDRVASWRFAVFIVGLNACESAIKQARYLQSGALLRLEMGDRGSKRKQAPNAERRGSAPHQRETCRCGAQRLDALRARGPEALSEIKALAEPAYSEKDGTRAA